ncbi:MAG TPA: lipase maturation factor family protein [Gemmatimonadaceae bacterium]|nr:lipase maturation factor family protein [Gemmatimonadaceae bacterium]
MSTTLRELAARWFGPPDAATAGYLWARWIFLRALGLIFFSAFYSLAGQVQGLIGPQGILPAGEYLSALAQLLSPLHRVWAAPTLFWLGAGHTALTIAVAAGIIASLLLTFNVWPRASTIACTVLFLSFVAALQVFSSYQSDGMLLEAGVLSAILAPTGMRPGLGALHPPSRASVFLLQWEWFRIYFESGVVKLASGDPTWRALTAMDHYYENAPLPTWIGYYVQHLPHAFHAAVVVFTLAVELVLVWGLFAPRRWRIVLFAIVSAMQVSIILTANYAFLNYLVLALGIFLLDDRAMARLRLRLPAGTPVLRPRWRTWGAAVALVWIFYSTVAALAAYFIPVPRLLAFPARAIAPFRIANAYGLFAVMTPERYEIEFQGTTDGTTWVPYPFRYKPQDPQAAPGIYAPYQPRFEWNLWFASLGEWQENEWVVLTQQRLLERSRAVLELFARDPFRGRAPLQVRAVLWKYWFTDLDTKNRTGRWWNRRVLGSYSGIVDRGPDGEIRFTPTDAD